MNMGGGMFGNLFNGSNIHNMSVNFNITGGNNGNGSSLFPLSRSNYGIPAQNNLLLSGPNNNILYSFKNIVINSDYNIIISDEYDKNMRPKGEFDTLNDYYFVSEYSGQNSYKRDKDQPNIIGEIINRKDKFPSIVTLLDYESVENKEIIDQILFNSILLSKVYKHKNFFLIFETSGSKEFGEPCTVTFDKNKGLFKKEIYSIIISE